MSPDLTEEAVGFIRKHAFVSKEIDVMFMRCFHYDITQESDAVFELRMMFYKHYPQFAKDVYIDIKNMMTRFEISNMVTGHIIMHILGILRG